MFVFCVGDALIAVLCSIGFPLFIVFVVFVFLLVVFMTMTMLVMLTMVTDDIDGGVALLSCLSFSVFCHSLRLSLYFVLFAFPHCPRVIEHFCIHSGQRLEANELRPTIGGANALKTIVLLVVFDVGVDFDHRHHAPSSSSPTTALSWR